MISTRNIADHDGGGVKRSENGINIHRFCEGYGVRVLPYRMKREPRPANVIYGGRSIGRLLRKDEDRTGLVIRCIQASNPTAFDDAVIWSVWCFIGAHKAQERAQDAISAFGLIDLAQIRQRAQRLVVGGSGRMAKTTTAVSILLAQAIMNEDTK
jgi:hypothetical protein